MREEYKDYLVQLYQCIPHYIFETLAIVLIIGMALVLLLWGLSKGWRKICVLLLIEYIVLIYCSTVVFRRTIENLPVKLIPFDRYANVLNGTSGHIEPELLMNVLVFIPVGLLIIKAFKEIKWWKILFAGISLSLSVETLQFCFSKGTVEIDDVIHNVAGCMIGYGIYKGARYIVDRVKREILFRV